jgi:dephospho-CoA kinase
MNSPRIVGLTGGIAAGKSTVLEIFAELGAATISADAVVHELLDGEPLLSRLRQRWGDEVAPEGRADRRRIGEIVFADEAELRWLEGQIHPLVRQRIDAWATGLGAEVELAVAEVPLLFEGEMHQLFDVTVAVISDDRLRSARAERRGHALNAERESLQLSQQEKAERADHVIVNDADRDALKERVTDLWGALLQR